MAGRSKLVDAVVATALAAGLVAVAFLLRGERVTGSVRVVDGDTLAIDHRRIRIRGIDAPELAQTCDRAGTTYPCGEVARDALRALTRSAPVSCIVSGRDRYGRDLAACRADGQDVGAALVRHGFAVSFGAYGSGRAAGPARQPRPLGRNLRDAVGMAEAASGSGTTGRGFRCAPAHIGEHECPCARSVTAGMCSALRKAGWQARNA